MPEPDTEPRTAGRRGTLKLFPPFGRVTAIAVFGAASVYAGELMWPCELLIHFAPHAIALLLLVALVAGLRRRWRHTAALVATAVALCVHPVSTATAGAAVPEGAARGRLKIVNANVHTHNLEHDRFRRWVEAEDPDLLTLIEVDDRWTRDLAPLRARLPHVVVVSKSNNFGIGLWSRHPVVSGGAFPFGEWEMHQIDVVVATPAGPVRVLVTHPPPPREPSTASMNRRILSEIAGRAAASQEPVIAAGDLNATPWSPPFRAFVLQGGFQRLGSAAWRPTWPENRLFPAAGLPLDHVLVRGPLRIVSHRVGANLGSDHQPIVVTVEIL